MFLFFPLTLWVVWLGIEFLLRGGFPPEFEGVTLLFSSFQNCFETSDKF